MASRQRQATRYPGVFFQVDKNGSKTFGIRYKLPGALKTIEERAGTEAHGMTAAKANLLRAERLAGKTKPNTERRQETKIRQEAEQWTLRKLWETYAETRRGDPRRYKGEAKDRQRFDKHFPPIENLRPEQLDALAYERWRRKIAEGRSPTTVWHTGELLRRIVRFGVEHNLCEPLPFKLKLTKPNNETTEFLPPEQLASLLNALESEHLLTKNLFKFLLLTGLRRGEALKLCWSDIDFEKSEVLLRDTKAGKDQQLPLSRGALDLLETHPRHKEAPELVFPTPNGNAWNCRSLGRVFARIRKQADLPAKYRLLHGLRHQFGSMLAESGASLVELKDLMRHTDIRVTQRYLHSQPERLTTLTNALSSRLDAIALNPPAEPKRIEGA